MKNGCVFLFALVVCSPLTGQTYTLNPPSLSFAAQANGFPPMSQTVTLSAAGPFQGLSVTSTQSWLSAVSPVDGNARAIRVGINPVGLVLGTYSGVVTVTVYTAGSSSISLTLPVVLQVTANTTNLVVSQQAVTMNYQLGQALPPPQSILVSSSSGVLFPPLLMNVSTSSGGNWLTVDPPVPVGAGPIFLGLASNIVATLAPGTYSGSVSITTPFAANSVSINVTLNVSGGPLLAMSTAPAVFSAQINSSAPAPQSRSIAATTGALNLSLITVTHSGLNWLTATLNSTTTPATLTMVATPPPGLPIGNYSGSVTVNSSAGPLTIPVTLQVNDSPQLRVDPLQVNLSSTGGNVNQVIQVRSSGTNFNYTALAGVTSSPPIWLTGVTSNSTTPGSVTLTANPSQLENGTYFGQVDIRGQTTGDPRVIVPVTFTVNRPIPLNVSPTVLSFSQVQGVASAEVHTVRVTSSKPVAFSARSTASDWLIVQQTNGFTDASLRVSINPSAALPVGNYTATITVSSPNASHTAQIAVSLSVTAPNFLEVSRSSLNFSGRAGEPNPPSQLVRVTSSIATRPLSFTVTSDSPWLAVSPRSDRTAATLAVAVNVSLAAAGSTVTGRLTLTPSSGPPVIIPVLLTVERQPPPAIAAVANSATFQPAALSPGMLCTITGTDLGPARETNGVVAGGRFTSTVAGVRVFFDGIPAPVLYASKTQINAAVPYQLNGRASASLVAEYNGVASNAVVVRLVDTAPGIFTTDGRRAAALNENGSVNGPSRPAQVGTVVVLYVTGEGQTTPSGVDGEIVAANNLRKPLAAVRVRLNGVELPATSVLYAGSAPELVSGLMQVNFRLPADLRASGAVPVEVSVGGLVSPPGVSISVR